MLRTIIAVLIAAHGIGHILFLIPLLGVANWGQTPQSWLPFSDSLLRVVGSVIWIAALVGFGIGVYGLIVQQQWWRTVVIVAAIISIVGLILFWANPVSSPVVSALVFNLVVLGALLVAQWPSVEAIGA